VYPWADARKRSGRASRTQRFIDSCLSQYPGSYITGDGGFRGEDGYVYVMGRTDDVINVAGRRLTGQPRRCRGVRSSASMTRPKGEVPRRFVVLKAGIDTDPDQVSPELAGLVRAQIGAIAALRRVDVVAALPKTRSGKTLRKTSRGIASGHASEPVPSAIDDVAALDAMRPVLREA
jgi:propionyl-CoA synthetase